MRRGIAGVMALARALPRALGLSFPALDLSLSILAIAFLVPPPLRAAVRLLDTYYSPKNVERPVRSSTKFIILHTTEGPSRGSGSKLKRNGEAHYMVDEAGRIYRVIDRKRVAYHCGRSMWNGLSSLDNCSVGIEVVGYHNKDLTAAQYKALKDLIAELKKAYRIPDDKVLTHSMVAYGAPNQWHRRSHRGRKRCGMRMALPSVRKKLGLASKPAYDPDVKAGRLVVADRELQQVLYSVEKKPGGRAAQQKPAQQGHGQKPQPKDAPDKAVIANPRQADAGRGAGKAPGKPQEGLLIGVGQSAWDVARGAYNAHSTVYVFPNGERRRGDEIKNWKAIHSGTRVILDYKEPAASPGRPAPSRPAGEAAPATSPASSSHAGEAPQNPPEALDEAAAVSAYEAREAGGNVIGPGKSAWDIARDAYAAPTTIYHFPNGEHRRGDEIKNWKAIPPGTRVSVAEGDANEPETIASLGDAAPPPQVPATQPNPPAPPRPAGEAATPTPPTSRPAGEAATNSPPPSRPVGEVLQTSPLSALLTGVAGAEWNSGRTIYVTEKGRVIRGDELDAGTIPLLTPETKVFSGYKVGGPITAQTPAFAICGPIWRDEGTQFLLPDGHLVSGDKIDPKKIPPGTMILYKD